MNKFKMSAEITAPVRVVRITNALGHRKVELEIQGQRHSLREGDELNLTLTAHQEMSA